MSVEYDDWNEVINASGTYVTIADTLREYGRIVIGWTDGGGATHHDVLFTWSPHIYGTLRGIHPAAQQLAGSPILFVSIMRRGCFGFVIEADRYNRQPFDIECIAEKLGESQNNPTMRALATLINGVVREL